MSNKTFKIILMPFLLIILVAIGIIAINLSTPKNTFIAICKQELPNVKNIFDTDPEYIAYQAWATDVQPSLDRIRNIYHKASKTKLKNKTISIQIYDLSTHKVLCGSFISSETLHNTDWSKIKTYDELIEKANIMFK